jgi:hypothetical protein
MILSNLDIAYRYSTEGEASMTATTRRSLLAAAALGPLGAIPLAAAHAPGLSPALASDPDAELYALIAAYGEACAIDDEEDGDGAPLVAALRRIEEHRPVTLRGAAAKLMLDNDPALLRVALEYLREHQAQPLTRVSHAAMLDLYRLLGVAL